MKILSLQPFTLVCQRQNLFLQRSELRSRVCFQFRSNQQLLATAGMSGDNFYGRFGQTGAFGQVLDAQLVSRVVHRGGGQFDLERVVVDADDLVAGGARLNGNGQKEPFGMGC